MAATPSKIDVKTELLLNGKVIANPRFMATPGKEATITQTRGRDTVKIKVSAMPTDAKMDDLKLDFDLEVTAGDRTIRSQPQVFAKSGSEAVMTLEESTKEEKLQFRILAVPK